MTRAVYFKCSEDTQCKTNWNVLFSESWPCLLWEYVWVAVHSCLARKRTQVHTCSGFSLNNKLNVSLFWMNHPFKSSLFVKEYMVFIQIKELARYYAKCPKRTLETHQYHHSSFPLTGRKQSDSYWLHASSTSLCGLTRPPRNQRLIKLHQKPNLPECIPGEGGGWGVCGVEEEENKTIEVKQKHLYQGKKVLFFSWCFMGKSRKTTINADYKLDSIKSSLSVIVCAE